VAKTDKAQTKGEKKKKSALVKKEKKRQRGARGHELGPKLKHEERAPRQRKREKNEGPADGADKNVLSLENSGSHLGGEAKRKGPVLPFC